jgi:hypothetical protein
MNTESEELVEDEEIVEIKPPKRFRWSPAIEYNNTSYDSMVLRAPTGANLLAMEKHGDSIAAGLALIQGVSGLPAQVVHRLPQPVIEQASVYLGSFSKPSRPAGSEASQN